MPFKPGSIARHQRGTWAFWRRRYRIDGAAEGRGDGEGESLWMPCGAPQRRLCAGSLGERHYPSGTGPCDALLEVMEANAALLDEAIALAADDAATGNAFGKAAEWLIENQPMLHEQAKAVRRGIGHPPRPALPQIRSNAGAIPRAYVLAWEFVRRLDEPLDHEGIADFLAAYQQSAPLALGELWAMKDMLRLALLELLCGHTRRILSERRLPDSVLDGIRVVISSMHALEDVDWKEIVATQSAVERILAEDPPGAYPRMDFDSREYCRRAVEELAQGAALSEEQVAAAALALAREAALRADTPEEARARHVGYYLVDRGRPLLEARLEYRPRRGKLPARLALRHPLACYAGAIAVVWLAGLAAAGAAGWQLGLPAAGPATCLALLAAFALASTQCAVNLVNWLAGLALSPRPVLRLDYSEGIPDDCRSLVAVPAMLTDAKAVHSLIRQLEVRYLANRDKNLFFALLTDHPDASEPSLPGDRRLMRLACAEVERLNARYANDRPSIFFFLHRPRKWNPQEGVWMGEERKRGKLADLNRLLLAGNRSAFAVTRGDLKQLASVRYVITLDADTRLPPDAARQLVGCMAHPLNRPRVDPATGMVVEGHALLQPRMTAGIVEAHRSPIARLLAGDAGLDPYTRHAGNLYHDAFGEGSFIGKGIYDVRAFEAALEGRFPRNRILSHDLIEGCFARSGSVSDIELFEGVPSRLLSDMSRRHRWIRGDWQIASWLLPRTPSARGPAANPLPLLSRWKIFDNLRRSLTPIFLVVFLALGCALAPGFAWLWFSLAAVALVGPQAAGALWGLFHAPEEMPRRLHLKNQLRALRDVLLLEGLGWCALPYTAHCHLDAIGRALYRLCHSRRHMLEWTTASDAESRAERTCREHYEIMWTCPALAMALACWVMATPGALLLVAPALLGWLLGPAIAWRASQPSRPAVSSLSAADAVKVGRWARQSWHYFETYVNEHGLPPDHVQERPLAVRAQVTSPTNIGMALLAELAACDLGYQPAAKMFERIAGALDTLERLEKRHGHLLNWYDIDTLRPADPLYVSSVDSGNLWGALIALRGGLEELRARPVVPSRLLQGIADAVEAILALPALANEVEPHEALRARLSRLRAACGRGAGFGAADSLRALRRICALSATLPAHVPAEQRELRQWTRALARQAGAAYHELAEFVFWRRGGRKRSPAVTRALAPLERAFPGLDRGCTLPELLAAAETTAARIDEILARGRTGRRLGRQDAAALGRLRRRAERAAAAVHGHWSQIASLTEQIDRLCAMDFRFLYDARRKALAIGYDAARRKRDKSHYDLIASESRLTSFLAISHGQIPVEHWLALGRAATVRRGRFALLSWSGSMFEYLMPMLFLAAPRGTLFDAACREAVCCQMVYGRRNRMPWGVSESCCARTTADMRYHYMAFGVPELALSPTLAERPVAAPYASALAMLVAPAEAVANLSRIEAAGGLGPYGFYDAIDHAADDPESEAVPAACQTVMAHHNGMALAAMANCLLGGAMQRRFMANPCCEAYDSLLQERVPRIVRPADQPTRGMHRSGAGAASATRSRRSGQHSKRPHAAPVLGEGQETRA